MTIIHLDPKEQQVPDTGPDECVDCKIPLEVGFGLAGGGYGAYTICPQCGTIYSKTQVEY